MYASSLLPSQLGIPRAAVRSGGRRRSLFLVRASDDDEIVPILSGRRKKEFNAKDMEKLRNPQLLGGQTIGDELGECHSSTSLPPPLPNSSLPPHRPKSRSHDS